MKTKFLPCPIASLCDATCLFFENKESAELFKAKATEILPESAEKLEIKKADPFESELFGELWKIMIEDQKWLNDKMVDAVLNKMLPFVGPARDTFPGSDLHWGEIDMEAAYPSAIPVEILSRKTK
jgi:hypothetical protein